MSTTTEAKYSPATRKSPDSFKTVLDSILNWSDVNVNEKKHRNSEYCCSHNRLQKWQISRSKNFTVWDWSHFRRVENSVIEIRKWAKFLWISTIYNETCQKSFFVKTNFVNNHFWDYSDFCALYTVFSYSLVLSNRFF